MAEIAAIVVAAAGAYTSHESTRFAQRTAKKAGEASVKAEKELTASEAKKKREAAFSVMKRRRAGTGTPRETVLTGSRGATGQAGIAGKTLLGQ